MAKIKVNLSKIKYNAMTLSALLNQHHIDFTPVIKCVAGDEKSLKCLKILALHMLQTQESVIFKKYR